MKSLVARSLAGLTFLILFLAFILFLSAGSFRFWQAWVYLTVWTVCVLAITLYLIRYDQRLLASRVQAGPTAETRPAQKVIQGLASLCFIVLFIIPGLDVRFHWSLVPPLLSWIANGLVVVGFVIVFLVFRENSFTSAVIEVAQEQLVVTTGPYAVVRHPMYAGASLLLLATPLALGSWVGMPFSLPIILVIVLRLLDEERYLRVQLNGYQAYCQQVRYRLLPGIW